MLLLSLFSSSFLLLFLLCWPEQMFYTSGHSMFALQARLCCLGDTAAGKGVGMALHNAEVLVPLLLPRGTLWLNWVKLGSPQEPQCQAAWLWGVVQNNQWGWG